MSSLQKQRVPHLQTYSGSSGKWGRNSSFRQNSSLYLFCFLSFGKISFLQEFYFLEREREKGGGGEVGGRRGSFGNNWTIRHEFKYPFHPTLQLLHAILVSCWGGWQEPRDHKKKAAFRFFHPCSSLCVHVWVYTCRISCFKFDPLKCMWIQS